MIEQTLDDICVNTIRFLSVDAVEKAGSGHPGLPMGAACMGYVLWDKFLRHNPANPQWPDRDRFVLSAGHGSMLLYSLLYLTGYAVSLRELQQFRQWDSLTPGHPEHGLTPGVEVTTGPLGQGFANGVGMAIAERHLASLYNREGHEIINHYTFGIVSDGDLEEGVASEAASLAGNLRLGKLVYLYDSNGIQQDGPTHQSFTEKVDRRFRAYGWRVIGPVDGMDVQSVEWAINQAKSGVSRPSLIICNTVIGYGSPHKEGTSAAHGEPLGFEEVVLAKKNLGWDSSAPFAVPEDALNHFRKALERGQSLEREWRKKIEFYRKSFPAEAVQLESDLKGDLIEGWDSNLEGLFVNQNSPISTRDASGRVINVISHNVYSFMGGAADLAGSTRTLLEEEGDFSHLNYGARNLRFGLREHAMGAIANGIALHGGLIPFAATFLVFSDYMRPAIRLAALMGIHVIFVFTHDSICLGEDGPTHQPVEQIMGLRMVPNLVSIRPADSAETAEAWKMALSRRDGPTALILSRQKLPVIDHRKVSPASGLRKGGYVLLEPATYPRILLIATGSEVHLALAAAKILEEREIPVRVISLPSWEIFCLQPKEYRDLILPPALSARISIEAGTPIGWERFIGLNGIAIGLTRFGASAPGSVVYEKLGFTPEKVVESAVNLLLKE